MRSAGFLNDRRLKGTAFDVRRRDIRSLDFVASKSTSDRDEGFRLIGKQITDFVYFISCHDENCGYKVISFILDSFLSPASRLAMAQLPSVVCHAYLPHRWRYRRPCPQQ